ncbi:Glyoxalase-like domain-containing protein [Primorskyibacter flagellatus]|uniref:Glyoxalase-like domain-containing protein n=1 Tax=Primorskyibacter flagellatus TaxID=1387277 RepID=A0A1W2BM42_9RHOB|nr:Glyoxalase-like domain-containing protein [Primorskyibacter flagellatus]
MLSLDHLAVSGTTLELAATHLEASLGVPSLPGGRHEAFGTHNRLLGLAGGLYLEAISIDPDAAAPGRPRWFGLDMFDGPARLTNWICRVPDLDAALARWPEAGDVVNLARGDLRWRMAVPTDGRLPFDGMFPALLEWQVPVPPGDSLAGSGCTLERLVVSHPEADALVTRLDMNDPRIAFERGTAGLLAEFQTPGGIRTLA